MITVYCGIFYIVDISSTDVNSGETKAVVSGINLDEGTRTFFFVIIVLSNLAFFIYWIVMVYFEVQSIIVKRAGKLYTFLCLCGNGDKFEKMKENIAVQEENEILREKFVEILDNINHLYTDGSLVLNSKNIEKINIYL
jgi:hypothetical protein